MPFRGDGEIAPQLLFIDGKWQSVAVVEPNISDNVPATDTGSPGSNPPTAASSRPINGASLEGFRRAQWGASPDEVEVSEERKPKRRTENSLVFQCELAGLKAIATYEFVDNAFASGEYRVVHSHSNDITYLEDYELLSSLLAEKYGNASGDSVVWIDDLYKRSKKDWGDAVASGHVRMQRVWQCDGGVAAATLRGDNWKVDLRVRYESGSLGAQLQENRREAFLRDL